MDFLDFYTILSGFLFSFVVKDWVGYILERFIFSYLLFFGDLPSLCFVQVIGLAYFNYSKLLFVSYTWLMNC